MKTKTVVLTLLMLFMLCFSGCRKDTRYGECVGVLTASSHDPNLKYETSFRNAVLAVVFIETVVVPVLIVGWMLFCPVDEKVK